MTISITVGGKPIAHKDIRVDHAVSGAASASFSFESGTTMRTGDIVEVNWGGKVEFRGIVKSMTLTSSGGEAFAVDLATLAPIVYPAAAKAPWEYGDIVRDPAGIILMYVSQARNGGVLMMPVAWPASRTAFSQGLMMWYGENNRLEAVE